MLLLRAEGASLGELDQGVRVVDLKVARVRWALLANMWPLTLNALWARAGAVAIPTGGRAHQLVAIRTTGARHGRLAGVPVHAPLLSPYRWQCGRFAGRG